MCGGVSSSFLPALDRFFLDRFDGRRLPGGVEDRRIGPSRRDEEENVSFGRREPVALLVRARKIAPA